MVFQSNLAGEETGFTLRSEVSGGRNRSQIFAVRKKWGLSLREVEDRSLRLAEEWGNPSYRISASWLARVERGDRDLSAAKLIVLAVIFSIPAEQLLGLHPSSGDSAPQYNQVSSPNTTLLLTNGLLAQQARSWLPEDIISQPDPEKRHSCRVRITCRPIIAMGFSVNRTTPSLR